MPNTKMLTGALLVVGLSVFASHFLLKKQIAAAADYNLFGYQSPQNGPSTIVSAGYLTPIATHAAPRMYVQGGEGSSPNTNPGESWIQGGGSVVTSTTGRWAA